MQAHYSFLCMQDVKPASKACCEKNTPFWSLQLNFFNFFVSYRRSVRSGYAFAHQEGFGRLITSGRMMRQPHHSTFQQVKNVDFLSTYNLSIVRKKTWKPYIILLKDFFYNLYLKYFCFKCVRNSARKFERCILTNFCSVNVFQAFELLLFRKFDFYAKKKKLSR